MAKAKGKGNLYGSTNPDFVPTVGQIAQARMLGSSATHCMAYGGAGSSKTFGWVACLALRCLAVPHRALAVRRHYKHARTFLGMQTIPEVMQTVYPGIPYSVNRSDWYVTFENGSELWLGGLDDGSRMDKILGPEYASIFVNECSEILSHPAIVLLRTRLRQRTPPMPPKMMYDQNPPSKSHWTHKEFEQGLNPASRDEKIKNWGRRFASVLMNPDQNWHNMADEYKDELLAMPERQRRRFLLGLYADEVEDALWKMDTIDHYRINPDQLLPMVYIVIAVDPAVTANEKSDETGICVVGKCAQGHYYIIEDASMKAHPAEWGRRVIQLFNEHQANVVVGEVNNGGELVEANIRNCPGGESVPYETIHASRGKVRRAEPVATLNERGMVHHVGTHRYLEDQMVTFNPVNVNDLDESPDRMDAMVWGVTKAAGLAPGAFTMGTLMASAAGEYEA